MTSAEESLPLHDSCFLVAGALGFIGKALVRRVVELGAAVLPLDLRPPTDLERSCLASGTAFFAGTLRECRKGLEEARDSLGGRRLFAVNLGGIASVPKCESAPALAFEANVQFALEFARVADSLGAECIVYPSTGYVYGDSHPGLLGEDFPVYPANVYISTKLAAERLLELFSSRSKSRVTIIRPSNVYGPGCSVDSVIGTILRQLADGLPIEVRSQAPLRDFLHIEDLVEAIIVLCRHEDQSHFEMLNISTACATSIGELAALAARIWGRDFSIAPDRTESVSSLILDHAKARRQLGWSPAINLREGLERIHGGRNHG